MIENVNNLLAQFERDGYAILRQALAPEQVSVLRTGVERAFAGSENGYGKNIRVRMFEQGPEFEALIDNPRVIDVVEAVLGEDCHLIAANALLTYSGESVASVFHADEAVRLPVPPGVELDPRIQVPCFVLNMNYYLCDVDEENGPTQFVPGSHRSGRNPCPEDFGADGLPVFAGRRTVSACGKAGDALIWHDQVWHRGSPISGANRRRLVQQTAYGRRYIAQRFYPFVNYVMPPEIIERANSRRKRLLGLHPRGAYG